MVSPSAAAVTEGPRLILYTRQGCCLCEGLEERLRELGLAAGAPAGGLALIDVDADPQLQARYGLEVPVLARRSATGELYELPRVPPRLSGERLAQWLLRHGIPSPPPGAD